VNEQSLAVRLVTTFESLGIPYFITGSMASIAQGEPRFTNDIDVVADIPLALVPDLLTAFSPPDFYVSEQAVREAIKLRFQFNILQITSGLKVDVMIPANDEFDRARRNRIVQLNIDAETAGWFASPEDVILKKLCYYREGGSEKHLRDIAGLLNVQGTRIDNRYLTSWADKLGVAEELKLVRDRISDRP